MNYLGIPLRKRLSQVWRIFKSDTINIIKGHVLFIMGLSWVGIPVGLPFVLADNAPNIFLSSSVDYWNPFYQDWHHMATSVFIPQVTHLVKEVTTRAIFCPGCILRTLGVLPNQYQSMVLGTNLCQEKEMFFLWFLPQIIHCRRLQGLWLLWAVHLVPHFNKAIEQFSPRFSRNVEFQYRISSRI